MEPVPGSKPHFMIDLETLSTAPFAAIHEIGWCFFLLEATDIIRSGSILVDPQSCVNRGLQLDWSTVQWWLGQEEEARKKMCLPGIDLYMALQELTTIFNAVHNANEVQGLWSHGASFDIPILDSAYRACLMKAPWSHRIVRDTRTLLALAGDVPWADNPVKHSAEHDAIAQAKTMQVAYHKLKGYSVP